MKIIYDHYLQKYPLNTTLEGSVMRLEGMWKMLEDVRFLEDGFSIQELDEFFYQGKKNYHEIDKNISIVRKQVQMLKNSYQAQFQDPESVELNNNGAMTQSLLDSQRMGSNSIDLNVNSSIDATHIQNGDLDNTLIMKSKIEVIPKSDQYFRNLYPNYDLFFEENLTQNGLKLHNSANPVYFRDFIEFMVRACLVKCRSVHQVGQYYSDYIKNHLLLIINGDKVPKPLLTEANEIESKVYPLENKVESLIDKMIKLLKEGQGKSPFPNGDNTIIVFDIYSMMKVIALLFKLTSLAKWN